VRETSRNVADRLPVFGCARCDSAMLILKAKASSDGVIQERGLPLIRRHSVDSYRLFAMSYGWRSLACTAVHSRLGLIPGRGYSIEQVFGELTRASAMEA